MTASLIICAYTLDRWADICEAVQSAREQDPAVDEIILVCDHNPQLKALCEAQFPDAAVIENHEAPGLSGARNSGIWAARGSLIVFLDDDAIADKHFVARLAAHCEQPGVIAASARVEPIWRGVQPFWFPDEFLWTVGCTYRGMPQSATPIRNASGGAMCMRRAVFEAVGGFNHRLGRTRSNVPISGEETELCIRARHALADAQIVFEPQAVIHHKVTAQRLNLCYFALRCYAEGVSKAYLSTLIDKCGSLSVEHSYVTQTLSRGFVRELLNGLTLRDWRGFGRAGAIALGVACAGIGFIAGKVTDRFKPPRQAKAAAANASGTRLHPTPMADST